MSSEILKIEIQRYIALDSYSSKEIREESLYFGS